MTTPLRSGPDIDWRGKCHPGDYQGETGACAVFAIANWVECMLGTPISDAAALNVWREERMFRHHNLAGGLQITEAFTAVMVRTSWLPPTTTLRRVSNLETLPLAPLVVGFEDVDWALKPGTTLLSRNAPFTHHAALAVSDIKGEVWVENSYGPKWGENGFARMTHGFFSGHAEQIWQIILPGASVTLDEAARKYAAELASSKGE